MHSSTDNGQAQASTSDTQSSSVAEPQSTDQRNADNTSPVSSRSVRNDDLISAIDESDTITDINNGVNTSTDKHILPPRKRTHFAMPSLSTESWDSVVQTYRTQFTTPEPEPDDKDRPKLPHDVAWKQQTLPAWQPQYRPATIVSIYLGLSVLMISMGIPMLITMNRAHEVVVDYTDCRWKRNDSVTCAKIIEEDTNRPSEPKCECEMTFKLPIDFKLPIYIYYELDGFYQNHRRYVASVDNNQLYGKDVARSTLESNCEPYALRKNDSVPYGPCGAIANSLFTDEFRLQKSDLLNKILIEETGITWPTDKVFRFKNPSDWSKYAQPKDWWRPANQLDPSMESNNGYLNEHFIVWMRTAAFPKFRKLWGKIMPKSSFDKLPAGTYNLTIDYKYPTVHKDLRIPKRFVIATSTWLGGRNLFLPILYIVCGSLSFITGIGFLLLSKRMLYKEQHRKETVTRGTANYQTMARMPTLPE